MSSKIKTASINLLPFVIGFAVGFAIIFAVSLHVRHSMFAQDSVAPNQTYASSGQDEYSQTQYAFLPTEAPATEEERDSSGCGCPLCCSL